MPSKLENHQEMVDRSFAISYLLNKSLIGWEWLGKYKYEVAVAKETYQGLCNLTDNYSFSVGPVGAWKPRANLCGDDEKD